MILSQRCTNQGALWKKMERSGELGKRKINVKQRTLAADKIVREEG